MAGAGLQSLEPNPTWRQCARRGLVNTLLVSSCNVAYKSYQRSCAFSEQQELERSRSELGCDLNHSFEALRSVKKQSHNMNNLTDRLKQEFYTERGRVGNLEERAKDLTKEAADCERTLLKLKSELVALKKYE